MIKFNKIFFNKEIMPETKGEFLWKEIEWAKDPTKPSLETQKAFLASKIIEPSTIVTQEYYKKFQDEVPKIGIVAEKLWETAQKTARELDNLIKQFKWKEKFNQILTFWENHKEDLMKSDSLREKYNNALKTVWEKLQWTVIDEKINFINNNINSEKISVVKNENDKKTIDSLKKYFSEKAEEIYNKFKDPEQAKQKLLELFDKLKWNLTEEEKIWILSELNVIRWQNIWNIYLLDKDWNTISDRNFKNKTEFIFNSWTDNINSENLAIILPKDFDNIIVWDQKYVKTEFNWKIVFLNNKKEELVLKTWDKFSVSKWNSNSDINKELIKREEKKAFNQLASDYSSEIKRIKEEKSFSKKTEWMANLFWDMFAWAWSNDTLNTYSDIISNWLMWILELFALLFGNLADSLGMDSKTEASGDSAKSKVDNKEESEGGNESVTSEPANTGKVIPVETFTPEIYKNKFEEVKVKKEDFVKIKEAKMEWFPEDIRVLEENGEKKYIRIDEKHIKKEIEHLKIKKGEKYIKKEKEHLIMKDDVSIYQTYDLWKFKSNEWKIIDTHKPYMEDILETEAKTWVPAEVLINLIYHENPSWDFASHMAKYDPKEWVYWLWQMQPKTWDQVKWKVWISGSLKNSNARDQILVVAAYLQHIKETKHCSWWQAVLWYHLWEWQAMWLVWWEINWKKYSANELTELYARKNPSIAEIIPKWEGINPKTYYIAALAFYNDISYDEAKKIISTSNTDLTQKLLKEKFTRTDIEQWQVDTLVNFWNKLELAWFNNINFDSKLEKSANWEAILHPIMQKKLEDSLPEIEDILENMWYKLEIFSWYRSYAYQQSLGSVDVWAHQFWLAIDIHIQKNWKNVWTKKWWKYDSIFVEDWPHSEVWEKVAKVLQDKWFRWGKSFEDTMHFDYKWIENSTKFKKQINYKTSQKEVYKQVVEKI